jgi:hypothetical protein
MKCSLQQNKYISGFSPESSVIKWFDLAGLLACFAVIAFPFSQWQLITVVKSLQLRG